MTNTETLKTYNEWRRGAKIPQPNPADIGIAIDGVLNELEELRANNNELRDSFKDALWFLGCNMDTSKYKKVLEQYPAQSLADIKAQAVIEASSYKNFNGSIFSAVQVITVPDLIEYANKLKGGE